MMIISNWGVCVDGEDVCLRHRTQAPAPEPAPESFDNIALCGLSRPVSLITREAQAPAPELAAGRPTMHTADALTHGHKHRQRHRHG